MRLEVVLLPVSDVDEAEESYVNKVGFGLDVDHQPSDDFRVVQMTPPGSACLVTIGIGLNTGEPGTIRGTHLIVDNVESAVTELTNRGVHAEPLRHMTSGGWVDGPHPEREDYATFSGFSDPDGNTRVLQEVGYRQV